MEKFDEYSIIVIGAGAAGLVVAIGAAKAGKKVLLIEKGNWGGDCTNYGCIPSKSLIAAAHSAYHLLHHKQFGIQANFDTIKSNGALDRTRRIVQEVRSHEDREALKMVGVETFTGTASFLDPYTLEVGKRRVRGKNIVIATGSTPVIPDIPGLRDCPFLTNETIFDLEKIPKRLGIIGGGPIGSELAQAFQRLGSQVTIIQHGPHLLKREELEAQEILEKIFSQEGVIVKLNTAPDEVNYQDHLFHVKTEKHVFVFDQLLVSAGRQPSVEQLKLGRISLKTHKKGIIVDAFGRTNYKHIWAIGDITGHALFTHVAEYEARKVLTNLLLPWPFRFKLHKQEIPRVTYTDPEIAAVGMSEEEAKKKYGDQKIAVYTIPFKEVDRAITANRTEGMIKIITKKWSSKILGCTIVGPRAGEMLSQVTTAMHGKIPLRKLASLIHPYPTYNLAIRKAADQWLIQTILPFFQRLFGMKQ